MITFIPLNKSCFGSWYMWYVDSLIPPKESQVEGISGGMVLTKSRMKITLFNAIYLLIFFIWTNSRLQRGIGDVFHIILTPKARLIWSCKLVLPCLHAPRIVASAEDCVNCYSATRPDLWFGMVKTFPNYLPENIFSPPGGLGYPQSLLGIYAAAQKV